jgi:hypothetical protein
LFTLCSNISIFTIYANFDIIILLTDIHPIDFSTYSKSLLWQMPYTHTHTHTNEKNTFFISFFFFFFVALHHNRLSFFLSFLLISHFVKIFCLQFFFLCNMREVGWLPKFIIIRRLSMFFWLNFFSRKNRSHFQNVKWGFHSKM